MSVACYNEKNKIRQSFSAAADSYDKMASLQKKVGLDLLSKFVLTAFSGNDDIILDIGCGTGFLTQELTLFAELIAVDIALPMLQIARTKLAPVHTIKYLCADAEYLPLESHSVNKIISNLALQWCQNLTHVFDGFSQALKPNGQLIFSTFGQATLQELKQAWATVDDYNHVNNFYSENEMVSFLKQAGFSKIQLETKQYQVNYPSVMALMRELKGIGASYVLSGRNKNMTSKGQMQKMIKAYEKKQSQNISATYEIIFVSADI